MAGVAWERCVREVTLSANPEVVGSLAVGWRNLSTALEHLRDALVGRVFIGPVLDESQRPRTGGLTDMLGSWQGSGGEAYREHLAELGKEIEQFLTHAANVSGALGRIESDIRRAMASIPIPLLDDFGWKEWSLPNGTQLDDAGDGADAAGFLRALRADYQSDPGAYADGAFRARADDLEATMKIDGAGDGNKRGGWWDTKSHLDNWYRDNQQAANAAMSPLPAAVETERPRLVVPPPDTTSRVADRRDDLDDVDVGGRDPVTPPPIGDRVSPKVDRRVGDFDSDFRVDPPHVKTDPHIALPPGSERPGDPTRDYGSGLAGVGDGGGYRGPGSLGGVGAGSLSPGGGVTGGLGAAGGVGGAGGIGAGPVAGFVGGGTGRMPPLTSAGTALRGAMAAAGQKIPGGMGGLGGAGTGAVGMTSGGGTGGPGGGQGARSAGLGAMGMMGGGLAGQGSGGQRESHTSWLTEDDDPWAPDDLPPGVLR